MKSHTFRLSLIVAVVAVLILTLSPKVIGIGIQSSTIDNILNLIPPEAESEFEITQQSLSSGWFQSESSLELVYTPIGSEAIALEFDLQIDHGPLLMTTDGPKFGLAYANITPHLRNNAFDLVVADLPFELPAIALDLIAGFDQSLLIELEVSPVNYSGADGEVVFGGLTSSFKSDSDLSADFEILMGQLRANENSARLNFNISGLEINTETEEISNVLAPSKASFHIPVIETSSPYPLRIANFSSNTSLSNLGGSNEQLSFEQSIVIKEISSNFPLNSFSWQIGLEELDAQALSLYYALLYELQVEMEKDEGSTSPAISRISQELLLITVKNALAFNNTLEANAYGGDHRANINIHWNGMPALNDVARMDINEALEALSFDLDISLDLEAVMSSPLAEMVDPYVQQGYVQLDNGRVLIRASLQDSVLTLNDEETAVGQFF